MLQAIVLKSQGLKTQVEALELKEPGAVIRNLVALMLLLEILVNSIRVNRDLSKHLTQW